ncbi:hypothetical protein CR513_09040, partial [Mucuna pruriens]
MLWQNESNQEKERNKAMFMAFHRCNNVKNKQSKNTLVPIYENKRDIHNCVHYKRIMSYTKKLWEKESMERTEAHMIFIYLKKAYDQAIQDLYDEITTCMRTLRGLHQNSTLSLYLFNLVQDILTRYTQKIIPKYILFAYDTNSGIKRSKMEYMNCNFSRKTRKEENDLGRNWRRCNIIGF